MNDLDSTTPFTAAEVAEITETANRAQHQRGTQGIWARRWLRLAAMQGATVPAAQKPVAYRWRFASHPDHWYTDVHHPGNVNHGCQVEGLVPIAPPTAPGDPR